MHDHRFREGEFVETVDGLIFGVKGLVHPPERVISFIKYVPGPRGNRVRGRKKFTRIYDLTKRYEFLQNNYPEYIFYDPIRQREMQAVPHERIKKIYRPQEKLRELMEQKRKGGIEETALKFAIAIARNSEISLNDIGISGSILVDLHTERSDIDLVVYGEENGRRLYEWLKKVRASGGWISPYDDKSVKKVYVQRWGKSGLPIKKLIEVEKSKILQGLVDKRDYFIRLVKGWEDIDHACADLKYIPMGKATVRAIIVNDRDSIFTPCRYAINKCEVLAGEICERIREICSFRGKFTEQARVEDWIVAKGKVEKVMTGDEEFFRLLLESAEDYLIKV